MWQLFECTKLTQCMRQADDLDFAIALNHLGNDSLTEKEILLFKSRVTNVKNDNVINIFRTNEEVNNFNSEYILKYKDTSVVSYAQDNAYITHKKQNKTDNIINNYIVEALNIAKSLPKDKIILPYELVLNVGVKYRIITNISVTDGLTNGTPGTLEAISYDTNKNIDIIWMSFETNEIGLKTKAKCASYFTTYHIAKNLNWVPILREKKSFKIKDLNFSEITISRNQFPIVITQAMTSYSCQSSTYSDIVVHPIKNKKAMERHELYVDCSRVTKITGLNIFGEFPKLKPNNEDIRATIITKELQRLETSCQTKYSLSFLTDTKNQTKIIVHNVQSLKRHFLFVKNDRFYNCADVINLHEAWLKESDNIDLKIDKFEIMNTIKTDNNKSIGCILYVNKLILERFKLISSEKFIQSKYVYIIMQVYSIDKIIYISIYKSNEASCDSLLSKFDKILENINYNSKTTSLVIVGDFNMDMIKDSKEKDKLLEYMKKYSLNLIINNEYSTDGFSQIDLVFTNNKKINAGYFESFLSYHKPIWITI